MAKHNSVADFSKGMAKHARTIIDRAVSFLYFYSVTQSSGASLRQIIKDFESTGLGRPNITKLRSALARDKRTAKISKDMWQLRADKLVETEELYQLDRCLALEDPKPASLNGSFVDKTRADALEAKSTTYDFARLIQMLTELDHAFASSSYISVIMLVRAILDHVPPIFGFGTFTEVANNYKGTKSFKDSISHLENSSRKIADSYLHTKIRNRESLPTKTQVNFSNDLDVLLAEIIRIA
jgi:hypothetical protein